jgi:molybdate transport system ATP-binding protein
MTDTPAPAAPVSTPCAAAAAAPAASGVGACAPIVVRLRLERRGFTLDVDLRLPGQGVTVLFGPSGSGKTTVLRCVAGLERAADARVVVGQDVWQDEGRAGVAGTFVPTWRRAVGVVFQEASLFDHLDVRGNLSYGLRRSAAAGPGGATGWRRWWAPTRHGDDSARRILDEAVDLLGIGHLLGRRVDGLSGGESQRVAIARALATRPRLLLLDEPLASLDAARKREILPWLARLRAQAGLPMLYVTHSADELARLADHVVLLADGRVQAQGDVGAMSSALSGLLADGDEAGAVLDGRIGARDAHWHLCRIDIDGGHLWLRDSGRRVGEVVRLRLPARDLSLTLQEPSDTSIQNHLPGIVSAVADDTHPSQVRVQVAVGADTVLVRVTRKAWDRLLLAPGRRVWVQVKSAALVD